MPVWRLPPWFPPEGANAPLLDSLARALPLEAPEQALQALDVRLAEGDWLNLHGALYGLPRLPGEEDSAYRNRILSSFVPRNTLAAIRRALRSAYGSADVEEFPLGHQRTLWESPVADGTVHAGMEFWPEAPPDPGAARIRVWVRNRALPPKGKDPVLEVVRSAGVIPDVVIPLIGKKPRTRHALSPWGFAGAHAGEARAADAYLAYLYLPSRLGSSTRMTSERKAAWVADGTADARGNARAGGW